MELGILLLFIVLVTVPFVFFRYRFNSIPEIAFQREKISTANFPYLNWLIPFILFIMVVAIFGQSTDAVWNVIDDHEIMFFLGPDGRLTAGEIISTLSLTEVGNFGLQERFRPSYYFLRILECVLCGDNPFVWHIVRLVILWLGISLTWHLVAGRLGWLGGAIFCAYILTFPFWTDTIVKLGAGEMYAVLGLPLYVWGVVQANKPESSPKMQFAAGLSILVGSVVCIGSKENFLLLLFPSAFVAWRAFRERKYILCILALGSVAFAIFVGTAVAYLVIGSGTDIYKNSISPSSRSNIFLDALLTGLHLPTLLIFITLILFLSGTLFVQGISHKKRIALKKAIFWLIVLLGVFCSQLIFYNGVWPRGNRYDFPGILYIPLTAYILYLLIMDIAPGSQQVRISRVSIQVVFGSALLLMIFTKGYGMIVEQVQTYVESTHRFTHGMQELSLMLNQNPDHALILECDNMWQYEPVTSTQRFLRVYGVQNPMFLRLHGFSVHSGRTTQERFLAADLERISNEGSDLFLPLSQLEEFQDRCFSLDLATYTFHDCTVTDTFQMEQE
jgi:hypothetical protein